MAVINESISGTTPSAEVVTTNLISKVSVGPTGKGKVLLESKDTGGEWQFESDSPGSYSVSTPSLTTLYRFRGVGLKPATPVHVFLGD